MKKLKIGLMLLLALSCSKKKGEALAGEDAGRIQIAGSLFSKGSSKLSLMDPASQGDIEQVKLLLSQGAEINVSNENGSTPLHLAAANGHRALVEHLQSQGAAINATTQEGRTPLHLAAANGQKEMVAYLQSQGAEINATEKEGLTPLHLAAYKGHLEIVQYLVDAGANLNKKNHAGLTPLTLAKFKKHQAIIIYLTKNGGKHKREVRSNFEMSIDRYVKKLDTFFKTLETPIKLTPMNIASLIPLASKTGDSASSSQAGQPPGRSAFRYPGSVSHSQQAGPEIDPNEGAERASTGGYPGQDDETESASTGYPGQESL